MPRDPDLLYWMVGRVAGLSCYVALSISLLSGLTIRSGLVGSLLGRRSLLALHEYTTVLWMPLGLVHIQALLLDRVSGLSLADVIVPFRAGAGPVAIGLGTAAFDLLALLAVTSWARHYLAPATWLALHRLAYPAYACLFLHSVLAGSDFSRAPLAVFSWGCAAAIGLAGAARAAHLLRPASVEGGAAIER